MFNKMQREARPKIKQNKKVKMKGFKSCLSFTVASILLFWTVFTSALSHSELSIYIPNMSKINSAFISSKLERSMCAA